MSTWQFESLNKKLPRASAQRLEKVYPYPTLARWKSLFCPYTIIIPWGPSLRAVVSGLEHFSRKLLWLSGVVFWVSSKENLDIFVGWIKISPITLSKSTNDPNIKCERVWNNLNIRCIMQVCGTQRSGRARIWRPIGNRKAVLHEREGVRRISRQVWANYSCGTKRNCIAVMKKKETQPMRLAC